MSVGGGIKARIAFKRLERDDEFADRVAKTGCMIFVKGPELDDEAWKLRKMRRRIVEDEA